METRWWWWQKKMFAGPFQPKTQLFNSVWIFYSSLPPSHTEKKVFANCPTSNTKSVVNYGREGKICGRRSRNKRCYLLHSTPAFLLHAGERKQYSLSFIFLSLFWHQTQIRRRPWLPDNEIGSFLCQMYVLGVCGAISHCDAFVGSFLLRRSMSMASHRMISWS